MLKAVFGDFKLGVIRHCGRRIGAALYADQGPARKLDVNRARGYRRFLRRRFGGSRQPNRQQSRRCRCTWLDQLTSLKCPPPLENLVGIYPVRSRHQRHTGTRLKRQLHNLPLLRHRTPPTDTAFLACTLDIRHDDIVELVPKPIPEGKTRLRHTGCRGDQVLLGCERGGY